MPRIRTHIRHNTSSYIRTRSNVRLHTHAFLTGAWASTPTTTTPRTNHIALLRCRALLAFVVSVVKLPKLTEWEMRGGESASAGMLWRRGRGWGRSPTHCRYLPEWESM